jgi:glucan phosphoethanolaminetransferase (alkaline phosphatase superfamily)
VLKVYKVKAEDCQSQLSFMLHYYITLMCNMFRFKHKKSSSGKIRVPNKSYDVNTGMKIVYVITFIWYPSFD